jgi:hypothetical protein
MALRNTKTENGAQPHYKYFIDSQDYTEVGDRSFRLTYLLHSSHVTLGNFLTY